MEHTLFFDGTSRKIFWAVKTGDKIIKQNRMHHEIYFDRVSDLQSKYIALHVGLFWCIGRFIIKNEDVVNVMIDSKSMFEHFTKDIIPDDSFIQNRSGFLSQLIAQRKLDVRYHIIEPKENRASKLR